MFSSFGLLNIFFYLLTTQTHTICRGALKFATQTSLLLNWKLYIALFYREEQVPHAVEKRHDKHLDAAAENSYNASAENLTRSE